MSWSPPEGISIWATLVIFVIFLSGYDEQRWVAGWAPFMFGWEQYRLETPFMQGLESKVSQGEMLGKPEWFLLPCSACHRGALLLPSLALKPQQTSFCLASFPGYFASRHTGPGIKGLYLATVSGPTVLLPHRQKLFKVMPGSCCQTLLFWFVLG